MNPPVNHSYKIIKHILDSFIMAKDIAITDVNVNPSIGDLKLIAVS